MTDRHEATLAMRRRWLARLSLSAGLAAIVVLLVYGGLKSITALLLGAAGVALVCAAAGWFLVHRGLRRWLASVVLVAAPAGVLAV